VRFVSYNEWGFMNKNDYYVECTEYDNNKFYTGYWENAKAAIDGAKERYPYCKEYIAHKVQKKD